MQCQKCRSTKNTYAADKVERPDGVIYRKYECKKCSHTFYSMEFPVVATDEFLESWRRYHRLTKLDKERKDGKCGRKKKKQNTESN